MKPSPRVRVDVDAVDPGAQVQHAAGLALGHDDVVERDGADSCRARRSASAASSMRRSGRQRPARASSTLSSMRSRTDVRQEAEAAAVDAEHGHVDRGRHARGVQHRAVAADRTTRSALGASSASTTRAHAGGRNRRSSSAATRSVWPLASRCSASVRMASPTRGSRGAPGQGDDHVRAATLVLMHGLPFSTRPRRPASRGFLVARRCRSCVRLTSAEKAHARRAATRDRENSLPARRLGTGLWQNCQTIH